MRSLVCVAESERLFVCISPGDLSGDRLGGPAVVHPLVETERRACRHVASPRWPVTEQEALQTADEPVPPGYDDM